MRRASGQRSPRTVGDTCEVKPVKPSTVKDAAGSRVRTSASLKFSGQKQNTEASGVETPADLSSHRLALPDKILAESEYNLLSSPLGNIYSLTLLVGNILHNFI